MTYQNNYQPVKTIKVHKMCVEVGQALRVVIAEAKGVGFESTVMQLLNLY